MRSEVGKPHVFEYPKYGNIIPKIQPFMPKLPGVSNKQRYWYGCGIIFDGRGAEKQVFLGPFKDEESVEEALKGAVDIHTYELDTKDNHRATQHMKADLLQRAEDQRSKFKALNRGMHRMPGVEK